MREKSEGRLKARDEIRRNEKDQSRNWGKGSKKRQDGEGGQLGEERRVKEKVG